MAETGGLIPAHGGYRNLKSFQIGQLAYDLTVQFCDAHIDRRSRTHDQMVQAARSGVQNIAEGSQASGTSKKTELKLTNVARASLEELRLDYEDFLRQRGLELWSPGHPVLQRFKARRCATMEQVRGWLEAELEWADAPGIHGQTQTDTDNPETRTNTDKRISHRNTPPPSTPVTGGSGSLASGRPAHKSFFATPSSAQLEANAALSLLNLCCYLLDRQLAAQSTAFERDGGFTERLYSTRQVHRRST